MSGPSFAEVILEVSDFVALVNQTFEYAYPNVTIRGELANFRVSKNRWVYFDLKDGSATVKLFGTVYQLAGPLEDGMILRVRGAPRLHPQYGFSVTILSLQPEGEGMIRKAAELLAEKLTGEGLFDEARKRSLPYPPNRIGLITSTESAAYADFIKVLKARWSGVRIDRIDVQVQGEAAPGQLVAAIEQFNESPEPPEVLVLIRGGGSPEDLYAYSTEQVTRAVAGSRVPTLVAIGHEIDLSLAELAADRRASTPSNAAELLVPDREEVLQRLEHGSLRLREAVLAKIGMSRQYLLRCNAELGQVLELRVVRERERLMAYGQLLGALNPRAVLGRGYAIVRKGKTLARRAGDVRTGDIVDIELGDGGVAAEIQ